jgi:hypothetical protein
MTIVLGETPLHLMRTSWKSPILTPEIKAWSQRVKGKIQRKMMRPTIMTMAQIKIIASII